MADAFRPSVEGRTLPFADVVSYTQGTSWWSPSAQTSIANVADLMFFRRCERNLSLVSQAWLGQLVDCKHRFIFQVAPFADDGQWYFGQGYVDHSAVVAWPCKVRAIAGSTVKWVEFVKVIGREPMLVPVVDLDSCRAWLW